MHHAPRYCLRPAPSSASCAGSTLTVRPTSRRQSLETDAIARLNVSNRYLLVMVAGKSQATAAVIAGTSVHRRHHLADDQAMLARQRIDDRERLSGTFRRVDYDRERGHVSGYLQWPVPMWGVITVKAPNPA